MADDVLLGVVIGPQGLSGEVRVKAFTETPEQLGAYGPLRTVEGRILEVVATRMVKADVIAVRFRGVGDRSAAEALASAKLFVPRGTLPATEPDEFYHADLIGLRVQDHEGRVLGEIRAIHDFGAGVVIEIRRSDESALLLPFSKEFVPQIDLANGYVTVTEPVDIEAEEERGVE
ncbi:MAG TPA: ribosome maturation factor RimM [Rhizomicrobium sp.]|jgi:16S rRNA processing protein RimM|nr:ribosome maturation factor RimM [Rhizomicrobium sp.]